MAQTVKLTGFRELEAALSELPKATGKNVLRRVARGALQPMRNHAADIAPDDPSTTGKDLHSSIGIANLKMGKVRFVRGKFRADSSTGIAMTMGPERQAFHGTFQEFGTVHHAARPFMRPAWDAGADNALEYIKSNLGSEINRAAVRLARKRAK